MFGMKFGQLLFIFGTVFVFLVIYQHNLLIKLNYSKQRFVLKKIKLNKEYNELMKEWYQLKDPLKTKIWATERYGMKDLVMSHVITLTTQAQGDFFVTSTIVHL
jgi:hypothetical protein